MYRSEAWTRLDGGIMTSYVYEIYEDFFKKNRGKSNKWKKYKALGIKRMKKEQLIISGNNAEAVVRCKKTGWRNKGWLNKLMM